MYYYLSYPIYPLQNTDSQANNIRRQTTLRIRRKFLENGKMMSLIFFKNTPDYSSTDQSINPDLITETLALTLIEPSQLVSLRKSREAILIAKYLNSYYYCNVPVDFSLSSVILNHKCSYCTKCYARPTKDGGCNKVRDLFNMADRRSEIFITNIERSKRIERYPFIGFGLETYNVNNPVLIITACKNFEQDS